MKRVTIVSPVFAVRDIAEALDFYRKKLGFHVAWTWGEPITRAGVALDDVELQLDSLGLGAPGPSVAYCQVAGIESYFEECRARGVQFTRPLGERPWGMRDFQVADPSGNRIGFGETLTRAS
jgi:catechol 2,3-dioxygenase-like lactoylglutathione lyase family enzyme